MRIAEAEPQKQFQLELLGYQERVEHAVDVYAAQLMQEAEEYGEFISLPVEACADILTTKAKRIRGILTTVGYEMLGGKDHEMIDIASAAMEALQTYLVVIDDMQDQSEERRGSTPAHIFVEEELLANTTKELGSLPEDVTINGALTMNHHALLAIGTLPNVPALAKLRASNAINAAMLPTGYGQTGDLLAPVIDGISDTEANRANGDKTKHYTFRAPLETGMYLAGGTTEDVNDVQIFAENLGEAYQLRNDLEVVDTTVDGVDRGDDIRSGKRTLLLHHALSSDSSLTDDQKSYLTQVVGRKDLAPREVFRCQLLLAESGAKEVIEEIIEYKTKVALESLAKKEGSDWQDKQRLFLMQLGRSAVGA